MLRRLFYRYIKPILEKLSRWLDQWGISPMQLTVLGLLINLLGCVLLAKGHFRMGSAIVLFAGLFDMLDGSLARSSGRVSKFGAFIDSVIDRYSDFLIVGGILIHFARTGHTESVILSLIVLSGAMLTSYTKARAESLIPQCDVGWCERPERIVLICTGGIFGILVPILCLLAILTHLTAIQRVLYAWRVLEKE
jgi:CDP-diacylglycerol--glycerol-3-phosphate 3-phosphatidyltransferase